MHELISSGFKPAFTELRKGIKEVLTEPNMIFFRKAKEIDENRLIDIWIQACQPQNAPSEKADALFNTLSDYLRERGIPVAYAAQDSDGSWNSRTRTITLRDSLSGVTRASVLAHEIGHYVHNSFWLSDLDRYEGEVIAQSVSFEILNYYGIDTRLTSVLYVAFYLQKISRLTGQNVLNVFDRTKEVAGRVTQVFLKELFSTAKP